jgi:hypothetical protein
MKENKNKNKQCICVYLLNKIKLKKFFCSGATFFLLHQLLEKYKLVSDVSSRAVCDSLNFYFQAKYVNLKGNV